MSVYYVVVIMNEEAYAILVMCMNYYKIVKQVSNIINLNVLTNQYTCSFYNLILTSSAGLIANKEQPWTFSRPKLT